MTQEEIHTSNYVIFESFSLIIDISSRVQLPVPEVIAQKMMKLNL